MKFQITIVISVLAIMVLALTAQDKDDHKYFAGGNSDISSTDRNRATKAIHKWTVKGGAQGGVALTDAPFHWDRSKVGLPVFLRVIKNDNRKGRLEVWLEESGSQRFQLYKTYRIHYFNGKLGPKTRSGDRQAPEGFYWISKARLNPQSSYHLSMDMGYPNAYDRQKNRTGNYLMIHGSTVSIGCFAMTNCSIEQIYTLVDQAIGEGQKFVRVHSFPFEMTDENLSNYEDHQHHSFWLNLKEGWDWFEEHGRPPNVTVEDGRYRFSAS